MSRILNEFNIGTLSDMPIPHSDIHACILNKSTKCLSEEEISYCNTVKELIDCLHGNMSCGLPFDECKDLIQYLATV